MSARRGNGEGTAPIQRKDGRWQVGIFYLDPVTGAQKRTTVTGKTQKEVRDKAKEVRKRLEAQQPAKDAKMSVERFAQTWIETTLAASDRKATTKRWYKGQIEKHISGSTLGATSLDRLRPSSIEAWILELRRRGLKDSSVRSLFTILHAVLDGAVRDQYLGVNPAAAVTRPKVTDEEEAAFLTPEQVKALLAAAASSRYALLFEFLVHTGLRRGEALALKWTDVPVPDELDDEDAVIQVRGTLLRLDGELQVTATKTKTSKRSIPVTPGSAAVLRALRRRQREERLKAGSQWVNSGFVFTTELGEPCDPRNALRAVKAAAKKAGLPASVGLHTLRHSAASIMLDANVPPKVVSEVFGHSSISITMDIYGHLMPGASRQAMSTLSNALAG